MLAAAAGAILSGALGECALGRRYFRIGIETEPHFAVRADTAEDQDGARA